MKYRVSIDMASPTGQGPQAITHGLEVGVFEARTAGDALEQAGKKGMEINVERLPKTGEPVRFTWRADPTGT